MERNKVSSTNIKSIGYDNGILEIEFINETIFTYNNVPKIKYMELIKSYSKGSFLAKEIKGKFSYRKIK